MEPKDWFFCTVIGGVIATFKVGLPAALGIILLVVGYFWFIDALNKTFGPDDSCGPIATSDDMVGANDAGNHLVNRKDRSTKEVE